MNRDITKVIVGGIVTILFCCAITYINKKDVVILELSKSNIEVVKNSEINYEKYINKAEINSNSAVSKVMYNKISTGKVGNYEVKYELKGKNNKVSKILKVKVKSPVTNIIRELPKSEKKHINKNKIFYIKDYSSADECYKKASDYVLSANISCQIVPIYKKNKLRNENNLLGYKVVLK